MPIARRGDGRDDLGEHVEPELRRRQLVTEEDRDRDGRVVVGSAQVAAEVRRRT